MISLGIQRTHQFEDAWQILQRSRLERSLDKSAGKEVYCFYAILSVANVASLDVDHTDNGVEDRGSKECAGWHADSDDTTLGANVLGCLLEGLFGHSEKNHGVGTKAFRSGCLDVLNYILGCLKVDVCLDRERGLARCGGIGD